MNRGHDCALSNLSTACLSYGYTTSRSIVVVGVVLGGSENPGQGAGQNVRVCAG